MWNINDLWDHWHIVIYLSLDGLRIEVGSEHWLNLRVGKWVFFFSKLFSHRFLLKCGNFKLSSKSHPACLQITDCMKPVRWVFFFGKFSEVSWRDIQNYYRTHKFNSFNGRLSLLGWVIQSMPIQPTIHENNARRQTQAHIRSRTQPAGKLSMGHSTPLTTPSPRRFPQNSNCCFPLCNGLRLTFLHLELQI